VKLIPADPQNEDHIRFLYECFMSRPEGSRISSKGTKPTLDEHREFVRSHPYADWSLIALRTIPESVIDGIDVGYVAAPSLLFTGAISLTPAPRPSIHGHEIGVDILPNYRGRHYADEAIKLMMAKHGPGRYMAHVQRDNYASMALFKRLGFEQVQVTFVYEAPRGSR
jgi:RimJ/RimL family protein N-acetyltransferase